MDWDYKSIFKSKTLWGLVAMATPVVLGWFGYSSAQGEATSLVTATQMWIEATLTYGGFVMAFFGRLAATKKLAISPSQ